MKKQLRIISVLFLLMFSNHALYAQWQDNLWIGKQANNWIFYSNNGINFDTQPPSQIAGAVTAPYEDAALGCGTISDASGTLLFSASSDMLFNSNFQPMVNGNELVSHYANAQEGLIIPVPNTNSHYVFHMHRFNNGFYDTITNQGALFYSEVDMDMDNGLGEVVNKNVLLDTLMSPKITAVHHADKQRVWVVGHRMMDYAIETSSSNEFYAYLVSENGISDPVISAAGPFLTNADQGQMKISPDGTKIAFVSGLLFYPDGIQLVVFDFDNSTGQVSNPVDLSNNINGFIAEGVEFSPNSRYLYVSEFGFVYDFARLHQFDLEAGDGEAILDSRVLLAELSPAATFASLQLAPDGKIYMANPTTYYAFIDLEATGHLSVIHNPNNAGMAANFEHLALALENDCSFGLPGFIQSYFESGILHEGQCVGEEVTFATLRIPGIESVDWDFGDPDSGTNNTITTASGTSAHIFSGPGTYTVVANITSNGAIQTTTTQITITQAATATQPENLTACDNGEGMGVFNLSQYDAVILGIQDPAVFSVTYHTSQDDAVSNSNPVEDPSAYISSPKSIYARITTDAGCYAVTQFDLVVAPLPDFPDNLELTGCSSVNLGDITDQIGEGLVLSFYFSQFDAEEGVDPIGNTSQFELLESGQTVYFRGETTEGCVDVAALHLIKEDCTIPRGISPNGDTLNDELDLSHLNIQSLEIFNRYGLTVYKKEGYRNEWHGQTESGDELTTGTYFYVLILDEGEKLDDKQILTGWVYINREMN